MIIVGVVCVRTETKMVCADGLGGGFTPVSVLRVGAGQTGMV